MKQLLNVLFGQPHMGMPSESNLCQIRDGLDRQPKCGGCRKMEALIQYWITRKDNRGRILARSKPEVIHNDYAELDSCSQQCITCRIIRRGLLMNQSTVNDLGSLVSCSSMLWATIVGARLPSMTLHISLEGDLSRSTVINFSQDVATIPTENTLPVRAATKVVYGQIKDWADTCHQKHPACGNLNWSRRNPTRLLHIASTSKVQLVECAGEDSLIDLVRYAALSYCWGSPDDVATQRGRTTNANLATRKAHPFPILELPATIRDAITLAHGCGLDYVWIDSVCIIQGNADDWLAEAHRMHEVYANAYFTICAVSVDTASAGLFHPREAWQYRAEHCRLAGQRVSLRSASCRDLVEGSAWSSRAWTLQEEHLSPRIIYWTPQIVYWSCSKGSLAEGSSGLVDLGTPRGLLSDQLSNTTSIKSPVHYSSFLAASRSGEHLHERWYDLVDSFTKRKLSNAGDKFAAISGIAMRYQYCRSGDQYLAGLWIDTFAQDLAWRTPVYLLEVGNALPLEEDGTLIPSWSWASLPSGHPAIMRRREQSNDELEEPSHQLVVDPCFQITEKRTVSAPMTRSIMVAGRIRPLVGAHSQGVDWSDISVANAAGQEQFTFMSHVANNVHSVDLSRGMVLVYEAHRDETLGYIDYLADADRAFRGVAQIECLELGRSEMLLVEPCLVNENGTSMERINKHVKRYRRIGVSWKFRADFFETASQATIELL